MLDKTMATNSPLYYKQNRLKQLRAFCFTARAGSISDRTFTLSPMPTTTNSNCSPITPVSVSTPANFLQFGDWRLEIGDWTTRSLGHLRVACNPVTSFTASAIASAHSIVNRCA